MKGPVLSLIAIVQVTLAANTEGHTSPEATRGKTVLVCADVAHFVDVRSTGATTVNSGAYMPANEPYMLNVPANMFVSLISTSAGKATVTEIQRS